MFHRIHFVFASISMNTMKSLLNSKYNILLIYIKEKLNNSMNKFSIKSSPNEIKC